MKMTQIRQDRTPGNGFLFYRNCSITSCTDCRNMTQQYTALSGELCPYSGEWEIIGRVTTTAVFAKGTVLPEYYGRKVFWMLIRAG